jgi:hypothetical protein
VNAQAGADPFSKAEDEVRAMAGATWWPTAAPRQRGEAISSRMLSGGAEWWLFGAWGRWYRCGLDGHWHPCPPPTDPAARGSVLPTPPGAGNPPVPPALVPTGPDLTAGRVASAGLIGDPPGTTLMARLQQSLITALSVDPAQFALRDPAFVPGTPSTVAAAWGALLWCAGSPVVLDRHPLIDLFAPYLSAGADRLRWMVPPDLSHLSAYYTDRLLAGDQVGASYVTRTIAEVAVALREDPRFQPGAGALAAITTTTLQQLAADQATARYGPAAITQEWQRRCPAEFATPILREVAPGEYLRLALYDLAETLPALYDQAVTPADRRRAAAALLAADLQAVPAAVPAVLPWLDPDSARTVHDVLSQPGHPLRDLWPREGRLPGALNTTDPEPVTDLLSTSYAAALTWCRLARTGPPAPGFTVPAAAAAELTQPRPAPLRSTGELTPWEIIDAARAHLAAERATHSGTPQPPAPAVPRAQETAGYPPPPTGQVPLPGAPPRYAPPLTAGPVWAPGTVTEAYGTRFLCGPDDIGQVLTEIRRRGQWAQGLRGRDLSSASAPAVLLVGAPSTGQRRLSRMIGRALADAGTGTGELRSVHATELAGHGTDALRTVFTEHAGHTVLLDGLDTLILDDSRGPAFAAALARARAEGVTDAALITTCTPGRLDQLTAAHPELITGFRVIRLPDLTGPAARTALLNVLATERHLTLDPSAWETARRDLSRIRGRGALAGARMVEAYLDRAATRHLGHADQTQAAGGDLELTAADFDGIAEELEPALRDVKDADGYRADLHALAGLTSVKTTIDRMIAETRVAAARRGAGLPVTTGPRHLAFAGNPGTGKSTVARILGHLYAAIGLLEHGHVVECTATDLAQAPATVRTTAAQATGGILVVDRAAALGEPGSETALGELTKVMDEHRDELIVICTDQTDRLRHLVGAQPALGRRVNDVLVFPDPSDDDLTAIFASCAHQQQYVLDDALLAALPGRLRALRAAPGFAAGRSVRRLFDDTIAHQSLRIAGDGATMSAAQLTGLTAEDLPR